MVALLRHGDSSTVGLAYVPGAPLQMHVLVNVVSNLALLLLQVWQHICRPECQDASVASLESRLDIIC